MLEGLFGIIVLWITMLGLIIGLTVMGTALVTHHAGVASRVGAVLMGWIGVYAAALLLASFASRPRYIPSGQERCFDEMCYSLKAIQIAPTLGAPPQQFTAQGDYYIVTVQLRSAAKRTAQKPSEPSLFVVDANGQRYPFAVNAGNEANLPVGQPVTARQLWDQPVQPGEAVSRTVAFDLPIGVRHPGLVVSEGIGSLSAVIIGDENSFFHAKTEFLLTR